MVSSEDPARKKLRINRHLTFDYIFCVNETSSLTSNVIIRWRGCDSIGIVPTIDGLYTGEELSSVGAYILCDTHHVMAKQHTSNTLRELKLDIAKRFYPVSQVYCNAAWSVVAFPCPKH